MKQYLIIFHTASCTLVQWFHQKINLPRLYLVICSYCHPTEVCKSVTYKPPYCCSFSFPISLFLSCFSSPNGQSASLCPELPVAVLSIITISQKERKKKDNSPGCSWLLHSIGLLYIVVLLLSMLLLLIAHFWEKKKWNCKTFMFYLWSKTVSFDRLVVHSWISVILKTVSCNIGV